MLLLERSKERISILRFSNKYLNLRWICSLKNALGKKGPNQKCPRLFYVYTVPIHPEPPLEFQVLWARVLLCGPTLGRHDRNIPGLTRVFQDAYKSYI